VARDVLFVITTGLLVLIVVLVITSFLIPGLLLP
jgi:hypothetical protein